MKNQFSQSASLSLLAAFLCLGLTAPAWGQSMLQLVKDEAPRVEPPIVVTANRSATPVDQVGSSISLITAEDLEAKQANVLIDVLRDVPGVSFSRNGGVGSVTSVRIRGAESDQTVVLIDGVKLNDPSQPGGGFNFANLLVGNIDRIEVLRGPQSSLYGSQALGGVINILTREPSEPFAGTVHAEIGELNSATLRAEVSGTVERFRYALAAGVFETDGISALDERAGGRERDPFSNLGLSGKASYEIAPSITAKLSGWWSQSEVGIDGFPAPAFRFADTNEVSETEEEILAAGLDFALLDGLVENSLSVNRTRTDRVNRNPDLSIPTTFLAEGVNERLDYQARFDISKNIQFVAGVDAEQASYSTRSPSSFNPNPRASTASADTLEVYAQGQFTPIEGLTTTLGVRRSEHDRFGEAVTLRGTAAYVFNNGQTIVRATAGEAYKAPSLFQLLSDFGNITLEPEEAFAWDIGAEHRFFDGQLSTALTYFNRETTNQIDFVSCFANNAMFCLGRPFGTYDNIQKTEADGIEASVLADLTDGWRIEAAYTQLDARNRTRSSADFGRKLARRASETYSLDVGYNFAGGHHLSVGLGHVGPSFDNASNTRRLAGYTLISLRGSYALNAQWAVFGRVENASDEAYQTVFQYGSPPREAFFGVRARF